MQIKEVKSKKELNQFIRFQRKLYKGNPYYVPALDKMEKDFFSPNNPMAENCTSQLWLAKLKGKVVGRVAAIINHNFNKIQGVKQGRFTHFDCIEDEAIAHKLLETAATWAKEQGMKEIVGPFGFTNLDKHGMLVEGFQELACQSSNYNYPYYPHFVESFGFRKQHDWVEREVIFPKQIPEKLSKFAELLKEKYTLKVVDLSNKKDLKDLAPKIFDLYNTTYSALYGVSPLNEKQKAALIKSFLPLLNPDFVNVLSDKDGKIVAFGINMLSLSHSLQKANGRLFPFGFIHLMRNAKGNKTLDLLLIGIHPDYQRKGLNAIVFNEIAKGIQKHGITHLETTQNLDSNKAIQNLWEAYENRLHKRARLYRMEF